MHSYDELMSPVQSGYTGEMSMVSDSFGFGGSFTSTSNQSESEPFSSSILR